MREKRLKKQHISSMRNREKFEETSRASCDKTDQKQRKLQENVSQIENTFF